MKESATSITVIGHSVPSIGMDKCRTLVSFRPENSTSVVVKKVVRVGQGTWGSRARKHLFI